MIGNIYSDDGVHQALARATTLSPSVNIRDTISIVVHSIQSLMVKSTLGQVQIVVMQTHVSPPQRVSFAITSRSTSDDIIGFVPF